MLNEQKNLCFHDYLGKKVHLIGIGGASMSGLAMILKAKGCLVSGSDCIDGESLRALRANGINVMNGHRADYVNGADLVVYSMAIPEDHIELAACAYKGIPVMERSVLLGQLSAEYQTSIAVCGTHGKTTVTSMLAQIMVEANSDPTVHIGGVLDIIGGSVRLGQSNIFLTEACEYRRNFMNLNPNAAIILNIDADHLDYYRDIDEIESSFGAFLQKLPENGWALGNADDKRVVRQLKQIACKSITFGMADSADYRMLNPVEDTHGYVRFDMFAGNNQICKVHMGVPGIFNAKNALAALAAAHHIGIDTVSACKSIERFCGAHRRFELTGTLNGAELFHDYGHNPTEMRNSISIAKKRCDSGRVWAVVQPHTYSRVKTMFNEYLTCTKEADITLVTDIFAAREPDPKNINSGILVDGMKANGINAVLTPTFEDAASAIIKGVKPGDLIITLGCGNIYMLNELLMQKAY